ncbi:MAG: hypothetical protein ACRDI2_00780 [Chloroflexota bacterium]
MDLLAEIEGHVREYVEGRRTVQDLHFELAAFVQDVADSDDERVQRLDGLAWLLISEFSDGHRTEDEVKAQLAAELERLTVAP